MQPGVYPGIRRKKLPVLSAVADKTGSEYAGRGVGFRHRERNLLFRRLHKAGVFQRLQLFALTEIHGINIVRRLVQ